MKSATANVHNMVFTTTLCSTATLTNATGAYVRKPLPIIERYERYINRTESCWLWTGPIASNGYPQIRVGRTGNGPIWLVHRWAYQHFVGPIPNGLLVLHHCDVRHCSNPAHLYVGTQADNMRDRLERHPNARGYRRAPSTRVYRLTDSDVRGIRLDDRPCYVIAAQYNISETYVDKVKRRKAKALVPDDGDVTEQREPTGKRTLRPRIAR